MAEDREEKVSFLEVVGTVASVAGAVLGGPKVDNIPTPPEPTRMEMPTQPNIADMTEDFISQFNSCAGKVSGALKEHEKLRNESEKCNNDGDFATNDVPPEDMPQDVADDEIPEDMPQDVADDEIPEDMPQDVADDKIPEDMPQDVADDEIPEDMPQDVADDEIPEDMPQANNEYSEGDGTGAEWTAEGIARMNGYIDKYYEAQKEVAGEISNEAQHEGREMDEVTRAQLNKKEHEIDAFLERNEV